MNIGKLQAMIVKIRADAISLGLSDYEIGQLEIFEINKKKTLQINVDIKLDLARTSKDDLFILFEKNDKPILKIPTSRTHGKA